MEQASKDQKIDLSELILNLKRHWWWFVISLVFCVGVSILYLYVKRPVYNIQAKVLVSSDEGNGMGSSLMKNLSILGQGSSAADDEIEIISSHSILVNALRNLGLNRTYVGKTGFLKKKYYYNDSPITISAPNAVMDTLTAALNFKIQTNEDGTADIKVKGGLFKTYYDESNVKLPAVIKTEYGIYSVQKSETYKPGETYDIRASIFPYNALAEDLADNISFFLSTKKSNSICIQTENASVKATKDLVNEIVALYNERGVAVKNEIAEKTKQFIDERLTVLYQDLSTSEGNIETFKKSNNLVNLEAEATYQMTKKGSLEPKLLDIESQISVMNMIEAFLKRPENHYSLIPFTTGTTESASNAVNQYNALILEYIKLKHNAKAENIALRTLTQQIDALRANVVQSIAKATESNKIILNDLNASSSSAEAKLGKMPAQEKAFIDMKRKQQVQNYLYSFLLEKKEENELVLAAAIPKGQVIDTAYTSSKPVSPKKPLIIVGALIFGFIIPIIIFYVRSIFKTTFVSSEELSKLTSTPILGEVCHNRHSSTLVVKRDKTSSIVELFRLMRNNIQFMLPAKRGNTILVTSSVSGEGKSFISINLAASLALLENKKVIILGMDIRSPQIANNLGIAPKYGLTNYLSSDLTVDETIYHDVNSNLDVIVAGPIPPNPSELLLSNRTSELFEALKQTYDFIVVDSAPIAMVSDTFSLAKYSDMTVYVSRASYTKKRLIKFFNNVVANKKLVNPAVVINDTNSKLSYGYGYGYGDKKED